SLAATDDHPGTQRALAAPLREESAEHRGGESPQMRERRQEPRETAQQPAREQEDYRTASVAHCRLLSRKVSRPSRRTSSTRSLKQVSPLQLAIHSLKPVSPKSRTAV